ncbi:hypothetical protein [Sphingomonas sp. KC8]|uniref:hypothetical protein n=1 Tax=Sphingomonas sp. KC8 TaxID=1030157 RepID=UPI000248939E|nr:hypothetical protein [Sphingomonas sp. KC8]ARS29062.1 hypothetical protein KC8_17470 [Sphingomonas sp. KC8]
MTDRPILFSAPMVRALLDGRKTQTRRIMKVQPPKNEDFPGSYFGVGRKVADGVKWHSLNDYPRLPKHPTKWDLDGSVGVARIAGFPMEYDARFAIGDRLWVKETWQVGMSDDGPCVALRANDDRVYPEFTGRDEGAGPSFDYEAHPAKAWRHGHWIADVEARGPWSSPLHMPRWASRLTLIVTDVRVERLQDISEADAIAEGIWRDTIPDGIIPGGNTSFGFSGYSGFPTAVSAYQCLWNHINGPDAWDANPWVVAVSFRVERRNIDRVAA